MILFLPQDHIVVIFSMVSISGLRTDGRYDKPFFSSTCSLFLSFPPSLSLFPFSLSSPLSSSPSSFLPFFQPELPDSIEMTSRVCQYEFWVFGMPTVKDTWDGFQLLC